MKKGYEFQEIVEPGSGRVHRIYTYNGKPCRRVPLKSHLAKHLAGYTLIEKDLRSADIRLEQIELLRAGETEPTGSRRSP